MRDSESGSAGSNPVGLTKGDIGLCGKTPFCEKGKQGSSPCVTPKGTVAKMVIAPD